MEWNGIEQLLGIGVEPRDLSILQVSLRGIIIFIAAIVMVRLADKRFLSKRTAVDAVLGFVIASMLARAINGSGPLVPTIIGGFVIVLLHRLLAHLSMRWHSFGACVKGTDDIVIENGVVNQETLRRNDFSERDLLENLRLHGVESPAEVRSARIERNGDVSVVRGKPPNG